MAEAGIAPGASGRLPALDGLRGLAAMVVFVCHVVMVSPALADAYLLHPFDTGNEPAWSWALTYTPLHLFWAGSEAVFVFFVLSGFVLALPAARGRQAPWRSYYPQRLTRLYLPIVAAVLPAYWLLEAGNRLSEPWRGSWLYWHRVAAGGWDALGHDLTVVAGAGATNAALWSLQWEVIFSLLLPLFLLLVVRLRVNAAVQGAVILAVTVTGEVGDHPALLYMGMFVAGVYMARHHRGLLALGRGFDATTSVCRAGVGVVIVLLLTAKWSLLGAGLASQLGVVASVVGACLAVWFFAATSSGRALGTGRAIAWLGKRSFSLYLVHHPVVVASAVLLGHLANPLTLMAVALPASLLVTAVFFQVVESPSLQAARRVGGFMRNPPLQRGSRQPAPAAVVVPVV